MLETRRFWEKTRETPDPAIGLSLKCASPISVNEGPGRFFPTIPHDDVARSRAISPQSLHERSIDRQIKTASLGPFRSTPLRQ